MNMKSCGLEEALHHEYCLGIHDMSKSRVFAAMEQRSTTFLIKRYNTRCLMSVSNIIERLFTLILLSFFFFYFFYFF